MDDSVKADYAKSVLENPVYKDTFEQLKTDLMECWKRSGQDMAKERETIWFSIKLLEQIQNSLESAMVAGKMADYQDILKESTQAHWV